MENDIWPWSRNELRVHCRNRAEYDTLMSWRGSKHGSTYMMPDGSREYDVTIPRSHRKRALDALRLRPKNRPQAVAAPQ